MRIFPVMLISVLCWGVTFSLTLYFVVYHVPDHNTGNFISFSLSDSAKILAAIGAILGIIVGLVVGAIIAGFQLNIYKASLLGLLSNLLFAVVLVLWTKEASFTHTIFNLILILLLISGLISGVIVSLSNFGQKSLR